MCHFAGAEIVYRADDLQFAIFDGRGKDRLEFFESRDSVLDILADGIVERIAGSPVTLGNGRLDEFYKAIDGAGQGILRVNVLHRGLHRTTTAVPQNHDERHVEFGNGVLDAAFDDSTRAADDVAGDAHYKNIADANVEEDFGGHSGIGAADDDGLGILCFGEAAKIFRAASRTRGLALYETCIAIEEVAPSFIGVERRSGFVGGCCFLCCFPA